MKAALHYQAENTFSLQYHRGSNSATKFKTKIVLMSYACALCSGSDWLSATLASRKVVQNFGTSVELTSTETQLSRGQSAYVLIFTLLIKLVPKSTGDSSHYMLIHYSDDSVLTRT